MKRPNSWAGERREEEGEGVRGEGEEGGGREIVREETYLKHTAKQILHAAMTTPQACYSRPLS